MGMICVNQYDADSDADTRGVPRCIASWTHTQDQVLYALYILAALLIGASTWTAVSRRQRKTLKSGEIGFSLSLRRWARTSRTAAIINRPVQLVVSFLILGITASRCSSYQVSEAGYYTVTLLYLVALVDDAVRFLAARYKVLYCFSPLTILEALSIASHFQVGFAPTKLVNGVATRTWLDFSIMRPVFILRSYVEMETHIPRSTKGWMMVRLGIKIFLMIAVGASIMFFLETLGEMPFFLDNGFAHLYSCEDGSVTRAQTETCQSETWSVMFSFYFTVVTLGTVGYGDNSPKTVLSRLLAIMFIVMGIILFSMEIENLINLYKLRQVGNPPFKPKADTKHVVVMGNPSFAQLSAILRELFHEDHASDVDSNELHAVVLGERKSKFTKGLVAKLEADPIFAARVTYVAGNPTRTEDLERSLAREAEAVFVFPNKLSNDPANEDAMNIMRVLAAKRYCGPSIRFLVMVLKAESARHMLAAGVNRDDVICENVIKMGTLAQSALSHGVSTMLANLSSSLSIDRNAQAEATAVTPFALLRTKREDSDLRFTHLDEHHGVGNASDAASASVKSKSWLHEYYEGAAKEMYLIHLSKKYAGMTFASASTEIFRETAGSVVLIAVEVVFSANDAPDSLTASESRVLLNPGQSLIMTEWMQCYVIADDLARVFEHGICPDELVHDELSRRGGVPTVLNPLADTFIVPHPDAINDTQDESEMRSMTAYAQLATPSYSPGKLDKTSAQSTIQKRQNIHSAMSIESVMLDRSLQSVALNFRSANRTLMNGNPYEHSMAGIEYLGPRTRRLSVSSDTAQALDAPSLSVLLNPRHIVVCSFLGEDSLASLQWLIIPLRAAHAKYHPPITIIDAAEPSPIFVQTLAAFTDVFYIQGSPLVYSELQRAGAKAAAAVIVLGKRTSSEALTSTAGDSDVDLESSIVDAEAIFTTMLVELEMDFAKIFTITELSDESNSKFMGMSFQIESLSAPPAGMPSAGNTNTVLGQRDGDSEHFWDYILLNDTPQQKSEKAVFGIPLYMSGRLLHPELCENMVVQTFYNPSIHKIIRQLVGGPRCTGVISTVAVPRRFRNGCSYGTLFNAFASGSFAGTCLGVYRNSTQSLSGGHHVELPIVITTPHDEFQVVSDDMIFVLVGVHTLHRTASRLQAFYRKRRRARTRVPTAPSAAPSHSFSRASISTYLGLPPPPAPVSTLPPGDALPPKPHYARESNSSFRRHFV